MSYCIEESIKNELWLLTISRRIGMDVGEDVAYSTMKEWLMTCEDKNLAVQVVDNAMLTTPLIHKIGKALHTFKRDYSLVMQRIKSDAIPEDKPLAVPQAKAKGKRAKRITGDGPRPETP